MPRTPFIPGAAACASCGWSDGGTPTYGKNGVYDEPGFGHGTWRLAGGRLTVAASNGKYTGTLTKEDGRFRILGHINDEDLDAWGEYCD